MDVRIGPQRKLSIEELMLSNYGAGEDSLEPLGQRSNPIFQPLMQRANSLEYTLMLRKMEGRRRRGERGRDDWMASLTRWT